jgi:flavin-dependent dehydrogenase
MRARYDAAVLGGGPAGTAAAAALASRGRRVILFERTRYEGDRVGETLGAEVRPLLERIALEWVLDACAQRPFRGIQSSWGADELTERAALFHPPGDGWHVDRAEFDRLLAGAASAAGVEVHAGCGPCALGRTADGWVVIAPSGTEAAARFLIDASGRGAPATAFAMPERQWLKCDRLVGLMGRLEPAGEEHGELLIEAVEQGWWYSVPLPDGSLLAALMTDTDLLPSGESRDLPEYWLAALRAARHTAGRAARRALEDRQGLALHVVRADTGRLVPFHSMEERWLAVGDAAMAGDPLPGNGVARALKSGIEGAEKVDRALEGEPLSLSVERQFDSFLEQRERYYGMEKRWPEALFWMRRRPAESGLEALRLDPMMKLWWDGEAPAREAAAEVEALVRAPQAVTRVLEFLRTPRRAHEAMSELKRHAPASDLRLLAGLQVLVERGLVSIDTV